MTALQVILWCGVYLVQLIAVIYFTRATARRLVGAVVGGAVAGLVGLGAIIVCKALGWWQIPFASTPYFLPIFYLALSIWPVPVYLVTWRVARRFGWRGLAVFVAAVAVIGPPRDYLIAATFPNWMVFGRGVTPILADGATYVSIVLVGHALMYFVAGRAGGDRLAR